MQKRLLLRLLFILISFFSLPVLATWQVIIDPGHGGTDHGAIGAERRESVLTLELAKKLAAEVNQQTGWQATLTREVDQTLSLTDRAKLINTVNGDVIISIHANWSHDKTAHGAEIYVPSQFPYDSKSEESQLLEQDLVMSAWPKIDPNFSPTRIKEANWILSDLKKNSQILMSSELAKAIAREWKFGTIRKRAVKQGPFYILNEVYIPAVLVEIGFLSHATEGAKLVDEKFQQQIASNLISGLNSFKEMMDKKTSQRHSP